ncbi:MAG: MFS transporter [Carnobacterium inhibens]
METSYKGSNRLIVGIVFGVITFWLFAQTMLNIVPAVQADLGISSSLLNVAISLTALFSGMFMVGSGAMADKFGRVKLTKIGLLLSIIGSLCLVFANGPVLLIIGRIIQGFSAATIMPATLSLMKTYFDGAERQRALSYWSIGSWGGSGICSLFGGMVATYLGWRWIFIFSIIFAILGYLLINGTPESKVAAKDSKKFDFGGLFSFVIMMLTFNLYITNGSSIGWFSPVAIAFIVIFIVSTLILIKIETTNTNSLIDFSLFKNRAYSGATLSNFLLNASAGTMFVANTYVQMGRGYSSFQSGLLTIGYLVCVLSSIRLGEKALQKHGARKPMLLGTSLAGVGILLMSLTFIPGAIYSVFVFIGYALYGLGLGFYTTPSTDTAISAAPVNKVGIASGVYKMASSLGGAIGVAISSSVYSVLSANSSFEIAGMTGLLVNVMFVAIAVISVVITAPRESENALPSTI